jgi:3-oxoacyl-[acyl-carrier protein] reductase
MVKPLDGKRVLVTGAASGIGRASALALQEAGAKVIGLDLKASDKEFSILACDLASEQDIIKAVNAAATKHSQRIAIERNHSGAYRHDVCH